jgi:hypothetical protein
VWALSAFALTRTRGNAGDGVHATLDAVVCDAKVTAGRSDAVAVMVLAAIVTALDAVASDLLNWAPLWWHSSLSDDNKGEDGHSAGRSTIFFCGNFGREWFGLGLEWCRAWRRGTREAAREVENLRYRAFALVFGYLLLLIGTFGLTALAFKTHTVTLNPKRKSIYPVQTIDL